MHKDGKDSDHIEHDHMEGVPGEAPLTVEQVRNAFQKASKGARQLNKELREAFAPTDATSALRLR